jgi:membrane protease YdiL (CAAX protease family)
MQVTSPPTAPPPGWHPDPYGIAPLRWWDGTAWSPWVWGQGAAPAGPYTPYDLALEAQPAWFPDIRTLRLPSAGLAGLLVALLVVGNLASGALLDSARMAAALIALAVFAVNLVGFPLAAVVASKRWGSGRVAHDVGLRFRPIDLALGLGGAVALFVTVIASGLLLEAIGVPQTSNLDQYGKHPSATLIVFLVVLAGVVAPLTEELLFRGVLLRGLTDRLPIAGAIVVQGLVFGCAHLLWDGGWGNVGLIIPLALVGCVLGFLARWTGRVSAGMVAHCLFNMAQLALYVNLK